MSEPLSQNKIDEIQSFYLSGMTIKEIQHVCNVGAATVNKYTKELPKRIRRPFQPTASQVMEMRALREHGKTNEEIAKMFETNPHRIRDLIGLQPDMARAAYGSVVSRVTDVEKQPEKEETQKMKPIWNPEKGTWSANDRNAQTAKPTSNPEEKKETPKPVRRSSLKRTQCVQTFEGHSFTYKTTMDGKVRISDSTGHQLDMTEDELGFMLTELKDLYDILSQNKQALS